VGFESAEFFGEQFEGAGDSWAVGPVEGDRDHFRGVVDGGGLVEQVAESGPVFVQVGEVGVEVFGEPCFRVEGEESQPSLSDW